MPHTNHLLIALVVGLAFVVVGCGSSAEQVVRPDLQSARGDDGNDQLPKYGPSPLTAPFDAAEAEAGQEAWAKFLGMSSPVKKNSIGMELVLIPPGNFQMGSPASEQDRFVNESQVDVTLTKSFYLGKTEVTQIQWQAVMGTTPWKANGKVQNYVEEGADYAATFVSWDDAQAFCKKLSEQENANYRLPTEAEWEFACRGGTTTRFSFGDDASALSNYAWWGGGHFINYGSAKNEPYAHEVARKQANAFGLYDMHGNVFEWCEDWYPDKLGGGTDPLVSVGDGFRVYRGGSWSLGAACCRSGFRPGFQPDFRSRGNGFRVALSSGQ